MPRTTAKATNANIIKINIGKTTRKRKQRRKVRKTVQVQQPQNVNYPTTSIFSTQQPQVLTQLRDLQISQQSLSDQIKKLNTSPPPPIFSFPSRSTPKKEKTPKPQRTLSTIKQRVKELKKNRDSILDGYKPQPPAQNPAISSESGGGGSISSYDKLVHDEQVRAELQQKFAEQVKGYDDLKGLKGFANKLGRNQQAFRGDLEALQDKMLNETSFFDAFMAQNISQYMTPRKGGGSDPSGV